MGRRFQSKIQGIRTRQKTIVDGIEFDSMLEAALYCLLKLRRSAGEIEQIKIKPTVLVKDKCPTCGDGPITWKVDFGFVETATKEQAYAEAKGVEVQSYRKRKKLWKADPPAKLEIWKGTYQRPKLVETILPLKSRS